MIVLLKTAVNKKEYDDLDVILNLIYNLEMEELDDFKKGFEELVKVANSNQTLYNLM